MSTKMWMPSLVSTMLVCRKKELNVIERNACNCFHPVCKPSSQTMATKVSWIISWVLMCLLSWTQCKKWIPIGSMRCVHTHWGMPTIEGWDNPNHVWNVVEKNGEDNKKVRKTSQIISQTPTPKPKHDKIRTQLALDVPL